MSVTFLNVREELYRLSNGQPTKIPTADLARMAADMLLSYAKAQEDEQSVNALEQLAKLEDTRK